MSAMKSNDDIEPCLTAVMPVYNEAAHGGSRCSDEYLAQRPVQQLIVVDDCSTGGTWEQLLPLAVC